VCVCVCGGVCVDVNLFAIAEFCDVIVLHIVSISVPDRKYHSVFYCISTCDRYCVCVCVCVSACELACDF
jgi:hypothetical protein